MNTILIVMIYLAAKGWEPQYAISFPTAKACAAAQRANYPLKKTMFEKKAVCVPEISADAIPSPIKTPATKKRKSQ